MSHQWSPVGDKDVPCAETIKKRLNYSKGKAPQESVREFENTLAEFRKAYKQREGEDWSRFYDWGSPEHQAQLDKVTEEFLEKEKYGVRFWPDDPTHPFINGSLIWLWDEERITELTKQLLYRKVHPRPVVPRHTRKVRKRLEAPVDSAPQAGPSDRVNDDARSTTAARATMSPPAQTAPGPSESIPRGRSVSPQPRAPEAIMEAIMEDPEGQKVKPEIVLRFDRIADAFKEPVMEPRFEPTVETPTTQSAGKTPAPVVEFTYFVIQSRNNPQVEVVTWTPSGDFSSKSLPELKEKLPLDFENGDKDLTFRLIGEDIRLTYPIDPTSVVQFTKMKREFRQLIGQCVSERREWMGSGSKPVSFVIEIERNGEAKRSVPVLRADPKVDYRW